MKESILNKAIEISYALLAEKNEGYRFFHTAFLVRRNRIMTIGWNKYRSHPVNLDHPYTTKSGGQSGIHAEFDVLRKSRIDDFRGYSMIAIRIGKSNTIGLSRPCLGCQSVIKQAGIDEVLYSNDEGKFNYFN